MRNEKDKIEASRKGTENTFAKFYSNLYSSEKPEDDKEQDGEKAARKFDSPGENETPIEKKTILKKWTKAVVVKTNVNTSQNSLSKNCKLRSTALETPRGSKVEDLKACHDATKQMMRTLFRRDHQTRKHDPESWSTVVIKVIFN